MKPLLAISAALFCVLVPAQTSHAQQMAQDVEVVIMPTGQAVLCWQAKEGRTYFIQASDPNDPLRTWIWCEEIEHGHDHEISHEVGSTADKAFFRLHYTDTPPPAGVTLEAWDVDGDSLPNALELSLQANPLNPDTNDDGIPDGWAHAHGHLPASNIATGLFQGGPATNLEAYQQGVQANPNATTDDLDGDLVDNDADADPKDFDVDWKPASVGGYALIDIGWPAGVQPGGQNLINDFNDLGHVLLDRHVWRGGQWHPIPLEEAEGSEETVYGPDLVSYESIDNTGFRLTPSGGILHVGIWDAHQPNPLGSIPFPNHIGHQTYEAATSTYGPFKSTLSTHGLMIDQGLVVPRPLGGDASGRIFADKTYTWNWEPEIWIYNSNMQKTGALAVPGNFDLGLYDTEFERARVTPSGWVAYPARSYTPPSTYDYRLLVWNPAGQIIADSENLPSGYTGFTELPHGKPALAYSYLGANGVVHLLNVGGTTYKTADKLGGKNIHTFAGDGSAMTSDGKMWINGKLTPLRDLCARYGELLDDGWSFNIHKANKHGVYLVQANKNEESRPYLLVPVDLDFVFGFGPLNDLPRQDLETKLLEMNPVFQDIKPDKSVFVIKGNPQGNMDADAKDTKLWTIQISSSAEALKSSLSTTPYVVFSGHSNMGLGPVFNAAAAHTTSDFLNIGNPQTAINFPYLKQEGFVNLDVTDAEIPDSSNNYWVLSDIIGIGVGIGIERFDNDDGIHPPNAIPFHSRNGMPRNRGWHFNRDNGNDENIIVNIPAAARATDLPNLGYKTFFYNSCSTVRDYSEVFSAHQGSIFIGSNRNARVGLGEGDELDIDQSNFIFAQKLMAGESWQAILSAMNAEQVRLGMEADTHRLINF